jgi:membrane protein DedA with SNARE-associated domain
LNPAIIFVVGAAGAIIGDTCGYWIGDKSGYPLLRRYGSKVRLDERKLKVARYLFARHGGKVVFFGRFVSVLRAYAAFLAGVNKMLYRRFLLFNAAGGIVWCAIYTFGAYWFGSALTKISGVLGWILLGVAVLGVVIAIVLVRRQLEVLTERAEAAFPGSLDG